MIRSDLCGADSLQSTGDVLRVFEHDKSVTCERRVSVRRES